LTSGTRLYSPHTIFWYPPNTWESHGWNSHVTFLGTKHSGMLALPPTSRTDGCKCIQQQASNNMISRDVLKRFNALAKLFKVA
jgi:hypothetical protein